MCNSNFWHGNFLAMFISMIEIINMMNEKMLQVLEFGKFILVMDV